MYFKSLFRKKIDNVYQGWYNNEMESTHDRVVASRIYDIGLAEIHRKGGGVDDSIWNHFGFYRGVSIANILR